MFNAAPAPGKLISTEPAGPGFEGPTSQRNLSMKSLLSSLPQAPFGRRSERGGPEDDIKGALRDPGQSAGAYDGQEFIRARADATSVSGIFSPPAPK
jgi:hypothetical protein